MSADGAMPEVKRKRGRPAKYDRKQLIDAAQGLAPTALDVLKGVATKSKSPAARVAAANAILDRGFGKPALPLGLDPDSPDMFEVMMASIAGKQKPVIG